MLFLCIAALGGCFLLTIRPDGRVAFRGAASWALPETCVSRSLLGIRCPGCGLTRSFVELARGDWRASIAHHRLGWVLAIAAVAQIPYRLVALRRGTPPLGTTLPRLVGYALVAALLVNWLIA